MVSTELVTRVLLTVIIVGSSSIDFCDATNENTTDSSKVSKKDEDYSLGPSISTLSSTPSTDEEKEGRSIVGDLSKENYQSAQTRLFDDSSEAGILLPFDEDLQRSMNSYGGGSSVSFTSRPVSLRISSGKALEQPKGSSGKEFGKFSKNEDKSTYFIRNNCFGPRCPHQLNADAMVGTTTYRNDGGEWQTVYYDKKDLKAKKYDRIGAGNSLTGPSTRYEDSPMESDVSSNVHSQLSIPFIVVDPSKQSSFSQRSGVGLDRYSRMTTSTSVPTSPDGWVKLKAISPEAYDPFRFSNNGTLLGDSTNAQSTFTKRDSTSSSSNSFSKRVGVELNPESFASRWGWGADNGDRHHDSNRGGSRLPAWLEDQLKYGNRNSDGGKNWVKLDPIPVAGVTISKWVPKGTPVSELPTTSWQNNRDRPSGGNPWWDREDTRFVTGGRPSSSGTNFLRPESSSNGGNDNDNYNGIGNGWGSKPSGSSLSTFDRYPTNSWNDIIYPDGPTSATVSWQQNKGGISSQSSSFGVAGSGATVGWSAPGHETRKPIVATGSWSAPPNNRFPSFINRFKDHRPSSYPTKPSNGEDPRWVLISNTRRVTSGTSATHNRRHDNFDRSKILQYINRLHPDLDRRTDFPFNEYPSSSSSSTSHRNGKDFWQWPFQGTLSSSSIAYPSKDEAFQKINATLSTLTPVLIHRGGTTVMPPVENDVDGRPSRYEEIVSDDINSSGDGSSVSVSGNGLSLNDYITKVTSSTLPPFLSSYIGDGRATSSNAQTYLQPTSTTIRNNIPGRIKLGLQNINPVYAAIGAGLLPATLGAVMPMVLGKRRRRDVTYYSNKSRWQRRKRI